MDFFNYDEHLPKGKAEPTCTGASNQTDSKSHRTNLLDDHHDIHAFLHFQLCDSCTLSLTINAPTANARGLLLRVHFRQWHTALLAV